jgi:hypothetical protein
MHVKTRFQSPQSVFRTSKSRHGNCRYLGVPRTDSPQEFIAVHLAGTVGVGPKEDVAGGIERVDNAIRDAADDLPWLVATLDNCRRRWGPG